MSTNRAKRSNVEFGRSKAGKRRLGSREELAYILICCEGITEKLYFEHLTNTRHQTGSKYRYVIHTLARDPKSLVEKSIETVKNSNIDFLKLWCVFDKDSNSAEKFNSAIQKCSKRQAFEINSAWSNESFELWYLLHFKVHTSSHDRNYYNSELSRIFSEIRGFQVNYENDLKTDKRVPGWLESNGSRNNALSRAKFMEVEFLGRKNFSEQNPKTTVHHLVLEILGLTLDV